MSLETTDVFYLMEKFIPNNLWDYLMFMDWKDNITLYKHCNTRHYINVDKEGNFYKFNNGRYEKISKDNALEYLVS